MQQRVLASLKRAIDVGCAAVGLLLLAPLFFLSALTIAVTSGFPVFFHQERPGLGGRPFILHKFRTMRGARPGEVWFRSDADRLTAIGRILRNSSIDELPELWNVLVGDMSLVGPRPLLMEYLPKYTTEENRRHDVRPGITGWAQVNGRQNLPFSRRIAFDVWYVKHCSLSLDIRILFMTALQLLRPAGVVSGQSVDEVDDIGLSSDRPRRHEPRSEDK